VSAQETKAPASRRRWYRRAAVLGLGFGGGLVGLGAGAGCAFSTPRWSGPVSDHFTAAGSTTAPRRRSRTGRRASSSG
jgi:hypothetical protein